MRFANTPARILTLSLQIKSSASFYCFGYHVLNSRNARRLCPSRRHGSILYMSTSTDCKRIAVIGGGASGMFAATAAADYIQRHEIDGCEVVVFEGTSKTMSKVRISGGGRCNVMHDKTKALPQILSSYPRGNKELRGIYTKRFTPDHAYEWFTSRGVQLKTESDGRMFPVTDDSQTIINALSAASIKAGVNLRIKEKVDKVELKEEGETTSFALQLSSKSQSNQKMYHEEMFDSVILATGSFPIGHEIARSLGHTIVTPVPSLFTFDSKDLVKEGGLLNGLSGLSVPLARITLKVTGDMHTNEASSNNKQSGDRSSKKKGRAKRDKRIVQEGPLLITHHGVSGPAALRLSAFAAREFSAMKYRTNVQIHFCPNWEEEQRTNGRKGGSEDILMDELWKMTHLIPKRKVSTGCPLFIKVPINEDDNTPIIPKRLWQALVHHSSIPQDLTWGDASKAAIKALSVAISSFTLPITGKGTFKEEFVTAGGIDLKEVQMTNMESKLVPGLFMCGEVLDVDGVTGGFNFMGCWSTGFVAGEGAAEFCVDKSGIYCSQEALN